MGITYEKSSLNGKNKVATLCLPLGIMEYCSNGMMGLKVLLTIEWYFSAFTNNIPIFPGPDLVC